ncbi:hypothetical protein [Streptomyces sp. NPDC056105]|uniref:hypothetical protein n=1 Tax=Streptomyces sp. NPDC056105 TaxID=3345714 RepID=UPI0035DF0BF3
MNFPTPTQPASHIGQATAIELSRAEAEVKAAVFVAKQNPRDIESAQAEMRFVCRQYAVAEKAFFSYPKAKQTIKGPSIHLARELALIWGNLQHGTMELSRDTAAGQSEILAYAWDLQRNSRSSQIFIAPHVMDTQKGKKNLTDLRDIYENNSNLGARRLREAIFAVLPSWFVAEAVNLCQATLDHGDGTPLEDRIEEAVREYAKVGVTLKQLEKKLDRPRGEWTDKDTGELQVLYQSVYRGEITRDEAFPPERITGDEITKKRDQKSGPTPDPAPDASPEPADWPEAAQPPQ